MSDLTKIDVRYQKNEVGDVRSQKKVKTPKKTAETLVQLLWHTTARWLKPLRLPRARQFCSRPGQPALTITGLTTRDFCRLLPDNIPHLALQDYLILPNPRVIEFSNDVVFLFYPPLNFNMIVKVVSVWIVLFM